MFNLFPETRTTVNSRIESFKDAAAAIIFVAALGAGATHTQELNEICGADKTAVAYGVAALTGDGLPSWAPTRYKPNEALTGSEIMNRMLAGSDTASVAATANQQPTCF